MSHDQRPLLEVRRLRVARGRAQEPVLADASFKLYPGYTALIGPSAAGKTTLLRLLARVYRPTHGHVVMAENLTIGYVPEFPGVYHRLSPRRLLMRTALGSGLGVPEATLRTHRALDQMRLNDAADTPGRSLDEGQRRRLALALAFVQGANVVLLDEPTATLDPRQRLAFWQDMYTWSKQADGPKAYLIATHHLAEVDGYCQRVLVIDRGRTRFEGSVAHLKSRAQSHTYWSQESLSSPNEGAWLEYAWSLADGYAILSDRPHPPSEWKPRTPSLWDGYVMALRGRAR